MEHLPLPEFTFAQLNIKDNLMSVLNETRQEVFTGNSRLCLEIGSIELTQVKLFLNQLTNLSIHSFIYKG